jgi:hypothetical protein
MILLMELSDPAKIDPWQGPLWAKTVGISLYEKDQLAGHE